MDTFMGKPIHGGANTVISPDKNCDFCHTATAVVDGKTTMGPWANMCAEDFKLHGVGLGAGLGQRLVKAAS